MVAKEKINCVNGCHWQSLLLTGRITLILLSQIRTERLRVVDNLHTTCLILLMNLSTKVLEFLNHKSPQLLV